MAEKFCPKCGREMTRLSKGSMVADNAKWLKCFGCGYQEKISRKPTEYTEKERSIAKKLGISPARVRKGLRERKINTKEDWI